MGVEGYSVWRGRLGGATKVVAPMVDASELAWRLLSRRYGAELCYTPMLHAHVFVKDARYRKENLATCKEDRPLVVQFCCNDPDTFVAACRLAAPHCDAVDLNLGCPQAIARRGHYGAYLQDEWALLQTMVSRASAEVDVPITCKIRVFEDPGRTVEYARMLEAAGASLLTVHGRTRDQKGPLTGLANWNLIKAVKDAVQVPVFANGNIQYLTDVERCLEETGVEGVMSAEGNLYNPALFVGRHPPSWEMALEYIDLAMQYPCPTSYARGHLFKLFHHCLCLSENFDLRHRLSKTSSLAEMKAVAEDLKARMLPFHTGEKQWTPDPDSDAARLPFPPWICQPYVRMAPEQHLKKIHEAQKRAEEKRRMEESEEERGKRGLGEEGDASNKKKKKMNRNPSKNFQPQDQYDKCACKNPKGGRCVHGLCRACCKVKCYTEGLDCPGHRILVKTKREKAAVYYGGLKESQQKDEDHNGNETHGASGDKGEGVQGCSVEGRDVQDQDLGGQPVGGQDVEGHSEGAQSVEGEGVGLSTNSST